MTDYDNLKLDHQLCFALYAATHALTRAYREPLERNGLTYTQYLVMLVLWESDKLSIGKISQRLDLDAATLSPLLKKLESGGLITRTRNSGDERVVEVALTEAGRQLQHEIAKVQHGVECKTGLNNEEFMRLKQSLHDLVAHMAVNPRLKDAA
jgi:DNA-binding MarR family transcriptional regulator